MFLKEHGATWELHHQLVISQKHQLRLLNITHEISFPVYERILRTKCVCVWGGVTIRWTVCVTRYMKEKSVCYIIFQYKFRQWNCVPVRENSNATFRAVSLIWDRCSTAKCKSNWEREHKETHLQLFICCWVFLFACWIRSCSHTLQNAFS